MDQRNAAKARRTPAQVLYADKPPVQGNQGTATPNNGSQAPVHRATGNRHNEGIRPVGDLKNKATAQAPQPTHARTVASMFPSASRKRSTT